MTAKRSISRGVVDALSGLPLFITAPLYRHWHLRWGATDDEVRGLMPGDDAVPKASFDATRAITIAAPPRAGLAVDRADGLPTRGVLHIRRYSTTPATRAPMESLRSISTPRSATGCRWPAR